MRYLVFGRTEYAAPLALVTTVESAAVPTLDDLDVGADWLELVVVPTDELIWIVRDGAHVAVGAGHEAVRA
jgi:hypothetical protein